MSWQEYGKDTPPQESKNMSMLWMVFLSLCLGLMLYHLGKVDGRDDALKTNIINCATVEILEDN